MLLIPATLSRISSRKDLSLLVSFETGELSPDSVGQLFGMQNKALYLAVKETAFTAPEADALDSLESDFIDDTKKTPSRRLRAVLYRLWQQDSEGREEFRDYYAAKMEAIIAHFRGKLE